MKGTLFPEQGAVVVEALFTGTFALIFELVSLVTKSLCDSTCVFGCELVANRHNRGSVAWGGHGVASGADSTT